jgi:hypothetical protein
MARGLGGRSPANIAHHCKEMAGVMNGDGSAE